MRSQHLGVRQRALNIFLVKLLQNRSKAKLIAYVGDTVDDISSALAADCVAINLLEDKRADYHLSDIKEIKKLVLE